MTYSNWKVKRDGRKRKELDELNVLTNDQHMLLTNEQHVLLTNERPWVFGGPGHVVAFLPELDFKLRTKNL